MLKEWKYYFYDTKYSAEIINHLIEKKEKGEFLGSTFPNASTHTCFNEAQCEKLENLIKETWQKSIYEKIRYFRGDLFDVDFGIKTFKQPFVQWCPSPIFSYATKEILPPEEPWGISMKGDILLNNNLRDVIANHVKGLSVKDINVHSIYDSYQIDNRKLSKSIVNLVDKKPLSLDCSEIQEWDIFSISNGIIVCSARFATLLKRDWSGMVHNKFQPLICSNISQNLKRRNLKKIPEIAVEKAPDISKDISTIEKQYNFKFPLEYTKWLLAQAGRLPEGWLSPVGGKKSELAEYIHQEHRLAEPAVPVDLIPVFLYGDGNSICIQKDTNKFFNWDHENGNVSEIAMPNGFVCWLEMDE